MLLKNPYLRVGLGLVSSWLFVVLSFYASTRSTVDWFSRSGAVMCLIAAAANFALVKAHQRDLTKIIRDQDHSVREKTEAILDPPRSYASLSWLGYVTGVIGTAIWGYGDLLL
jgi:hypothetical protein